LTGRAAETARETGMASAVTGAGHDMLARYPRDVVPLAGYVSSETTMRMAGQMTCEEPLEDARGAAAGAGPQIARHLRTIVHKEGGVRSADAINTLSPTLPRGKPPHAGPMPAGCPEQGTPTV
jgi:hypothetical protein